MINYLTLTNYKELYRKEIKFGKLAIFTGDNGTEKSSTLKYLLDMKKASDNYKNRKGDIPEIKFIDNFIVLTTKSSTNRDSASLIFTNDFNFTHNFLYLSANRSPINSISNEENIQYSLRYILEHKEDDINIKSLKVDEASNYKLHDNVNEWISKINNKFYDFLDSDIDINGTFTYCLPIILSLFKAKKGDSIVIEKPEAFLSPRLQIELANLCIKAINSGVQLIIETNSEYFINQVRIATKKGELQASDTNIYFFSKNKQDMCIDRIKINDYGKYENCPTGFFNELENQLKELL